MIKKRTFQLIFLLLITVSCTMPTQEESTSENGVKAIYTGREHSLILYMNGNLYGAGSNASGQLGIGESQEENNIPFTLISGNVRSASAGSHHSLYLTENDELYVMGKNDRGQLGTGDNTDRFTPVLAATNVRQAEAMSSISVMLTNDGTLYYCGSDVAISGGGFSVDGSGNVLRFFLIDESVESFFIGYRRVFYLKDGHYYALGYSDACLGTGIISDPIEPHPITIPRSSDETEFEFLKIVSSSSTTLFLDGTHNLYYSGSNSSGQAGFSDPTNQNIPTFVMSGILDIATTGSQSLLLREDGSLWACGDNSNGELGLNLYDKILYPEPLMDNVKLFSMSASYSLLLTNSNTFYGIGYNTKGQFGIPSLETIRKPVLLAEDIASFSAGGTGIFAIDNNGTLLAGGKNINGELGTGSVRKGFDRLQPIRNGVLQAVLNPDQYNVHSLILDSEQNLYGFGRNQNYVLGSSTFPGIIQNMLIAEHIQAVVTQTRNTFYLTNDNRLYGLGANNQGQLGLGYANNTAIGEQVLIDENVETISAGELHLLYLKMDGTLWGCGADTNGQLGLAITSTRNPTPVKIAENVKSLAAGPDSSAYIDNNGTGYVFGSNAYGKLGLGDYLNRSGEPVQLTGLPPLKKISMGKYHTLFLTENGELYAAGSNRYGHLSPGEDPEFLSPVLIIDNVADMEAGYGYSLILDNDGSLWGLGSQFIATLSTGLIQELELPE